MLYDGECRSPEQFFDIQSQHWRVHGSCYFITWSLHPSQPPLSISDRDLVAQVLERFHQERYRLYAYVVMDDHVHVIASPLAESEISKQVQGWKSVSAHALARAPGRVSPVWQKGYHDRIIRTEDDLLEKMNYVIDNPRRRWPQLREYPYARWFPL